MPAYNVNRLAFVFFAAYLLAGYFVLMNLTFARIGAERILTGVEGGCFASSAISSSTKYIASTHVKRPSDHTSSQHTQYNTNTNTNTTTSQ